ncbi:imidazolonepropionase-like amidohydrolase [Nocardioides salarius]|uniref:Imidazolonepropionase-like amidohydrolase n=1 Tax=Nocardioides salarius TaxID=374513 RepID=A0ABS2M6T3_9ACTN|nr:amidohydrolase family protein [Nocardioides salarius]MBM7506902.1 imidazolonepropionase-like amidohydrolase [Nocardioides salarius]
MSALKFTGPVLPDGESRDLYVVDGRVTFEAQPGAETAARGWIVPGLVDAHNHLGMEDHGAVGDDEVEGQALADRDAGALLLRDCGSPADTRWVHERDDLPRLVRAGRHIARTRRYIRSYAHEVEPAELSAYVAQEAQAGDGWVKLVGDWISRDAGDLAPSFPQESFAEAIEVAHRHGAKVTAHCFGHEALQGLLDAGIDCIEHGTGLALEQVEQMAAAGVALVPTVMQTDKFPGFAAQGREKFPAYAATMDQLHARRREVLMSAHEAGVPLYVGSDGGGAQRHGHLAGEVLAMAQLGMPAADVLAAASWKAREWLGFDGLVEGAGADFVVYDRDPAQDLTALWEPACVVLRGRVVA